MLYQNVQLHNIAEVRKLEGREGVLLQRVPEATRLLLNDSAKAKMLEPAGAEIRFLSRGNVVRISLASLEGESEIRPFWGGFQSKEVYKIGTEPTVIELVYPQKLAAADLTKFPNMPFSPRTWRLLLSGRPLLFHGIEGEGVCPPEESDLPRRRMIAYGTSITQGGHASGPHLTYVAQLARRLQADLCNLGSSGSAHCEAAIADYMAGRQDWDVAVLCLSVNMIGAGFTTEQFVERTTYLIRMMADQQPARPIFCFSILPHFRDFLAEGVYSEQTERTKQFRIALRRVVESLQRDHVHFIEGPDLLTQIDGLSIDMIHPGDFGMMEIAEQLYRRIVPHI